MNKLIIFLLSVILFLFIYETYFSPKSINKKEDLSLEQKEHFHINGKTIDNIRRCQNKSDIIMPGNYYYSDSNDPNFTSNVLNIHKFYKINNESDDLFNNSFSEKCNENICDQKPCFSNNIQNDYSVDDKPISDIWNYKNELPMNGGKMGNIVGNDQLLKAFPDYADTGKDLKQHYESNGCYGKADDIRFGLGYPNRESRRTGP